MRELGIEENTLIFFTSDNGPWFEGSAGPFRGRKGQSYEGGFHVPMIARWPGRIPAGTECGVPMMNIDLYPTILSAAGVKAPKDRIVDGRNILPVLAGQKMKSPHEALFYYHYDLLEGVRVGKWKYFRKLNRYVWPVPLDGRGHSQQAGQRPDGQPLAAALRSRTRSGRELQCHRHLPGRGQKTRSNDAAMGGGNG